MPGIFRMFLIISKSKNCVTYIAKLTGKSRVKHILDVLSKQPYLEVQSISRKNVHSNKVILISIYMRIIEQPNKIIYCFFLTCEKNEVKKDHLVKK